MDEQEKYKIECVREFLKIGLEKERFSESTILDAYFVKHIEKGTLSEVLTDRHCLTLHKKFGAEYVIDGTLEGLPTILYRFRIDFDSPETLDKLAEIVRDSYMDGASCMSVRDLANFSCSKFMRELDKMRRNVLFVPYQCNESGYNVFFLYRGVETIHELREHIHEILYWNNSLGSANDVQYKLAYTSQIRNKKSILTLSLADFDEFRLGAGTKDRAVREYTDDFLECVKPTIGTYISLQKVDPDSEKNRTTMDAEIYNERPLTDEEKATIKLKRETLSSLVQITTKTLELKKLIAKSLADKDFVNFDSTGLILAQTNICDALNLIEKSGSFLSGVKNDVDEENKMARPMNRDENLRARKALCNAETYIRTIRECLWKEPTFDVEKTLTDLENVRSVVKRICDAIPDSMKVMKPVSELVVGEDGAVSIRCFDPEKAYCDETAQERYEASKDDCDDGSETLEEREATSRNIQEEVPEQEEENERWAYVKLPSGREKEKLDAMKAIYDLLDAFFLLKFKLEKRPELNDAGMFDFRLLDVKRATSALIGAALGEDSE